MVQRILRGMAFGLVSGYLLAVFLSNWTWLEMRLNVSMVIPIAAFSGLIHGICVKKFLRRHLFYAIEAVLLIVFLVFYRDIRAFSVIPGVMFREAFFIDLESLSRVNVLLFFLFLAANLLWVFPQHDTEEEN